MNGRSRAKGARGERRWCRLFEEIGVPARRVGALEAGRTGKTHGWDIELGGGAHPWKLQAKEVQRFPNVRRALAAAHLLGVRLTGDDDYLVLRMGDLPELARLIAEASRGRGNSGD